MNFCGMVSWLYLQSVVQSPWAKGKKFTPEDFFSSLWLGYVMLFPLCKIFFLCPFLLSWLEIQTQLNLPRKFKIFRVIELAFTILLSIQIYRFSAIEMMKFRCQSLKVSFIISRLWQPNVYQLQPNFVTFVKRCFNCLVVLYLPKWYTFRNYKSLLLKLQGGWVLLQNCHLGLNFMDELLETVTTSESSHEGFRVWITTEAHNQFPISLLQVRLWFIPSSVNNEKFFLSSIS